MLQVQSLLSDQRQGTARSAHHDVRTAFLDSLLISLNWKATKENRNLFVEKIQLNSINNSQHMSTRCVKVTPTHQNNRSYLYIRHVLWKSLIFFADLESEFTRVAHYKNRYLAIHCLNLLKCGQDKDRSLPHTGFSLTQDVHAEDGLRYTFMLHWRGKKNNLSIWRHTRYQENQKKKNSAVEIDIFLQCIMKGGLLNSHKKD